MDEYQIKYLNLLGDYVAMAETAALNIRDMHQTISLQRELLTAQRELLAAKDEQISALYAHLGAARTQTVWSLN